MTVILVATLFPKAGKADRMVELLDDMSKGMLKNEPNAQKYQVTRALSPKDDSDELCIIEEYTDMDAVKLHGSTDAFKGLMKTIEEEGLAAQPMRLQMLKPAGGYASRL